MRSAPRFSLTLLRKGRGQDGDLLFLQLSDFILQLANSLPNCPDLGRVIERAEGDTKVLQTALLPGSSSPLVNSSRDPSLIPSGRTHRPGSPAVPCPGVPPGRPAPCPHRPSCHPPARAEGVIGITSLLWFSPRRTHGLPGLSFLAISHPSLPLRPGILHSGQTPPRPPVPTLLPRLLTCLSSWVLSRMAAQVPSPWHLSPEGLKILSLELPYCPQTLTLPSAFTLRTPKSPTSRQRLCP